MLETIDALQLHEWRNHMNVVASINHILPTAPAGDNCNDLFDEEDEDIEAEEGYSGEFRNKPMDYTRS